MKKILYVVCFLNLLIVSDKSIGNDVNSDLKVGVDDAITALQISSGIKTQLYLPSGFSWKGNWSPNNIQYRVNDVVTYDGSSYICTLEHKSDTTRIPTNEALWNVIARKGEKGDNGTQGVRGMNGLPPEHEWKNSSLRFKNPDGTWGKFVNLKGEKGESNFYTITHNSLNASDGLPENAVFVDHEGNVGIGTTVPSEKIEINGATKINGKIQIGNNNSTCNINNEGSIRYDYENKYLEFCNGSSWMSIEYNSNIDFQCGDDLFDKRNNKSYPTVNIGSQCWLAKNLNVGTQIDGTIEQANNVTIEKYCYENNEENCSSNGGLYQWAEAMNHNISNSQGICPEGWHIPSDNEWKTLELYLGMAVEQVESEGWRGTNEGAKILNGGESGFNGLLSGFRRTTGAFDDFNRHGYFWSSSSKPPHSYCRGLMDCYSTIIRAYNTPTEGYSIRCLKD